VTRFFTGSVAGGTIHTVPGGGAIASAGDLSSALGTATSTSLGPRTEGEVVFLTGTAANPILLNGDVGIDGDVVLQGYVKGRGSLYVSGNVYLPSDVRYLDGSEFGRAADGSENLMGVVAGGSLLVGNVFHPSYGKGDLFGNGTSLPSFSLLMTAEFNRREWAKTQPVLPGAGEDLSIPASWSVANKLFEGTDYVPRYFRFSSDQPVPIFNKKSHFDPATGTWIGPELAWDWDTNYLNFADPTDPSDPTLFDGGGVPIATVQEFTRKGGWISDALLQQMMEDALAARSPGPLQFDGALYSSNSIVGIASNYDSSGGELRFRGAVIGADLGLLAPDGLTVLYDDRVRDLLNIRTATAVEFRESTRLLLQ